MFIEFDDIEIGYIHLDHAIEFINKTFIAKMIERRV